MTIDLNKIHQEINALKALTAKVALHQVLERGVLKNLHDAEFKVFSQFGDDGIIQYLVHVLKIEPKTFIEFGVEDYTESNTRFLLTHNNWRGLVLDGNKESVDYIKADSIYWRQDLTAVCAFVDTSNINNLFSSNGFSGDIGMLSIDVDGNDYWIWDAINIVNPVLVIVEYNSVFGENHAITIPYDPKFYRTAAHHSNLYWGCSLRALHLLAERKGYFFIGSNSNGNNAYFLRKDSAEIIKPKTVEEGYVRSKYRESRDIHGNLTYIGGDARLKTIEEMLVVDLMQNKVVKIKEL